MDEKEFHSRQTQHLKAMPAQRKNVDSFTGISTYVSGQYDKDEDFQNLTKHMEEIESKYSGDERNRVFYMALPPSVFTDVAEKLKKNCYTEKGKNRIIVEKPFGKDLESSRDMMGKLKALWKEEEVRLSLIPIPFLQQADTHIVLLRYRPSVSTTTSEKRWSRTS